MGAGQIVREILVGFAMLSGTFFMLVTAIGLLRFPDVYTRMHAAGKAGTIGIALLIVAPTLHFAGSQPFLAVRGILAIVFQCLTTPGATYLLAHACYVTAYPTHERTTLDEFREWMPVYPDGEFGRE